MKKHLLMATALVVSGFAFAQQKKAPPPPPPPPPAIEATDILPPPAPPAPPELLMTKEYAAFLKRNTQVKQLEWNDQKVTIQLKSGKKEVYDLGSKEDTKKLKDKYGEIPDASMMPPPPPPPAPPPPPPPAPKKTRQQ